MGWRTFRTIPVSRDYMLVDIAACRLKLYTRQISDATFIVVGETRYDTIVTTGVNPSFLARRANLRSSKVATRSQPL